MGVGESINVDYKMPLGLTHSDVNGVAGWRAEQLRGEAALDPVPTTVAALVESLYVGQCELHSGLGLVRPLRNQRCGHSMLVQVEVTEMMTQQNAAAEADSLTGREHSVRWQQGEGGR